MSEAIRTVRAEIRATKAEMRERGIRRSSCFNGGHSAESSRLNARMFLLESRLEKLQAEERTSKQ